MSMAEKQQYPVKHMVITPEIATEMLERNKNNRPIRENNVNRIARQIRQDKWRFNGDTIKIADSDDVLDGQHRLWAVIEAKKAIETLVVTGIPREAFPTIDTIRALRSGSDVLALEGASRYRGIVSYALQWLRRWQKGTLLDFRNPKNRIENADIVEMYATHGGIVRAAERAVRLRRVVNPALLTFMYYVAVNRNPELAERMMRTLEFPAGVGITDPFFALRAYFLSDRTRTKDALTTIALTIKALNAAYAGKEIKILNWKNQGERQEDFPVLKIEGRV